MNAAIALIVLLAAFAISRARSGRIMRTHGTAEQREVFWKIRYATNRLFAFALLALILVIFLILLEQKFGVVSIHPRITASVLFLMCFGVLRLNRKLISTWTARVLTALYASVIFVLIAAPFVFPSQTADGPFFVALLATLFFPIFSFYASQRRTFFPPLSSDKGL